MQSHVVGRHGVLEDNIAIVDTSHALPEIKLAVVGYAMHQ